MKKILLLLNIANISAITAYAQQIPTDIQGEINMDIKHNINVEKRVQKRGGRSTERKTLIRLTGREVSDKAKQSFINDFGNLSVSQWERLNYYDKATFIKDGHTFSAFYDANAKLVGTTFEKSFDDLPANAQTVIKNKYKKYSVSNVSFFDDNKLNETDKVLFGLQFDDADSFFVELKKGRKKIVIQADEYGNVSYFTRIK